MKSIRTRTARRAIVLALAAALGVSVLGVTPALAASSPGEGKPVQVVKGDPNADLRFGMNFGPQSWDPHKVTILTSATPYLSQVYDRLLITDPVGNLLPMLATKWETSSDGKTLTLTLRDDVSFQDGSKFDATVAKANLDRAKTLTGSTVARYLTSIDSVDVLSPTQLKLNLNKPDQILLQYLAWVPGMMISMGGMSAADLATNPAGSGAYKLVSSTPTAVSYTKNPTYWDKSITFPAKKELLVFPDETTKYNALVSGQIDAGMFNGLSAATAADAKAKGYQIINQQTAITPAVQINSKLEPLNKPEVVQALNQLIDREVIGEAVFGGAKNCTPAYGIFAPTQPGYIKNAKIPFSVTKAKKILSDAGVTTASLNTIQVGVSPYDNLAVALQGMFQQGGITMNLTKFDGNSARAQWRGGTFPLIVLQLSYSVPDPSDEVATSFLGPDYPGGAPADVVTAANAAAALPLGSAQRDKAYQDLNKMIMEKGMAIPVCNFQATTLATKSVVNGDKLLNNYTVFTPDTRFVGLKAKAGKK